MKPMLMFSAVVSTDQESQCICRAISFFYRFFQNTSYDRKSDFSGVVGVVSDGYLFLCCTDSVELRKDRNHYVSYVRSEESDLLGQSVIYRSWIDPRLQSRHTTYGYPSFQVLIDRTEGVLSRGSNRRDFSMQRDRDGSCSVLAQSIIPAQVEAVLGPGSQEEADQREKPRHDDPPKFPIFPERERLSHAAQSDSPNRGAQPRWAA